MIYGKNNMKKLFTLLLLPLAVCPRVLAQSIAPFQKGDRVTFVGNSITDGGHYHSYIWLYYMTHFPGMRLWMANCGVGGDTAKEILPGLNELTVDLPLSRNEAMDRLISPWIDSFEADPSDAEGARHFYEKGDRIYLFTVQYLQGKKREIGYELIIPDTE